MHAAAGTAPESRGARFIADVTLLFIAQRMWQADVAADATGVRRTCTLRASEEGEEGGKGNEGKALSAAFAG